LWADVEGQVRPDRNLTCVHTGWVFTRTIRNSAHARVLAALQAEVGMIPRSAQSELCRRRHNSDDGTEFLNKAVIKWAAEREVYCTRSRPYKKNDQATIESKNDDLGRKYGFYRYDTEEHRRGLNRLWKLVDDRFNIGWGSDQGGRHNRFHDKPDAAGPAAGRQGPLPRPERRTARLPRRSQQRRQRTPATSATCRPGWSCWPREDRSAQARRRPVTVCATSSSSCGRSRPPAGGHCARLDTPPTFELSVSVATGGVARRRRSCRARILERLQDHGNLGWAWIAFGVLNVNHGLGDVILTGRFRRPTGVRST